MTVRVAVVGKGGSGKSTVSGTLARLLARRGHRVLALDSDPMPGLAISLGMGNLTEAMLAEAVEQDLNGRWHLRKGIGGARAVSRFSVDGPDHVRLLQFGKADADGLGSIYPSVSGFGQVVHRLANDGVMCDWSLVGDLSAGTRQAAYDWAPYARHFLVVVEPTWKSILTGKRLVALAKERKVERIDVVVNKAETTGDIELVGSRMGLEPVVAVGRDEGVASADRLGLALVDHAPDSPAVAVLDDLADVVEHAV